MILTIKNHVVKDIKFGNRSSYADQVLTLDKNNLINNFHLNNENYKVDFAIAKPNESKRIIHITDVVKPSWKEEGSSFPGWTSGDNKAGCGITHQLENMTVMQCCSFQGIQEGIVDMTGVGAKYTLFSSKINFIMMVDVINPDVNKKDLSKDLNLMILLVSEYIASLAGKNTGDILNTYEIKTQNSMLPNIGYAYFIQAQGPLRNVHIYGEDCVAMNPRLMHPNEIKDGAVVSGNYIIACQKNPTFFHQENPIINLLYEKDGKELNFSNVILSTESSMLESKKDNASAIAALAKQEGMNGIIITQEGGGHADVDLMLTAEACEEARINTVIITNEIAGSNGDLPPLVSFSKVEDAIITCGNNDEVITLDSVKEVIGGDLINGNVDPYSSFDTSLGIMYTATNQLGANKMTSIEL
jgi:glycine reductase